MTTYSQAVLADNPVGYWTLDDTAGTTAVDSSVSAINGTYVNTPTLAAAGLISGTSVSFTSAQSEYVNLGNPTPIKFQAVAFSVEAWIDMPAGTPGIAVVSQAFNGGSINYMLGFHDGVSAGATRKASFGWYTGGVWELAKDPNELSAGVHHLVGTYNGTTQKLYVDGVEVASRTPTWAPQASSSDFYIGRRWDAGNNEYWNGRIDEVAIYGYELTASQIANHRSPSSSGGGGGGALVLRRGMPTSHWTVDGTPVFLANDWTAQAQANRGFDQMRGTMTERSWRRLTAAGQGSVVKGYSDDGQVLWEGRLSTIPQLVNGEARFAAQGYFVEAEKKDARLFIQSKDMDIWTPLDGEPFVNSAGASFFDTAARIDVDVGNRIAYTIGKDESVLVGAADGAGFWAEGVNLKRIAFTMAYSTNMEGAGLRVRLQRATGPSGTPQNVNTWSLTSGNNGTEKDETAGVAEDMFILNLENTTSTFTDTATAKLRLSRIRVNSDINTTDTFHAYQVVDYIADTLGWDTAGIQTSTYNILPFDWQDGDWADAASYVAELEDKQWGVYESTVTGPRVVYDAWGATEWTVYMAGGATPDLTPLEVYNKALVWFEAPNGKRRRKAVTASPDPLSGTGITNTFEYDLEDRQSDATLAEAVANKLINRYSRQRYAGKLTVTNAISTIGRDQPYGIHPGDTVRIADWAMGEDVTLRVVDVVYRPDRIELGVEQPINLNAMLERIARRIARRRRRRRR